MELEEKIISSQQIYQGSVINVECQTVALPNGKEAKRDVVLHPGGAAVVAINNKGEIYMVRQYRKPINAILLEIPAGKLDYGEDPMECAKRELKEETGVTADSIRHLVSMHSSPGFSNEVIHIYLATGCTEGKECADEDEFITWERLPLNLMVSKVMKGEITDSKSIIGILMVDRIIRGLQY